MLEQKSKFNLTEICVNRHYRREFLIRLLALRPFLLWQFSVIFFIFLPFTDNAQISLSEKDIKETVSYFQTEDVNKSIFRFKNRMPDGVTDSKFRQSIYENLPPPVKNLRLDSPEILELLKRVISPVQELYGRDKVYDIIVFRHSTPVMFSDSGVVLVISTGMLERAESDDEILGYVAHEIGHEYFSKYSVYSKYLLKLIEEGGGETALKNKLSEILALIELECDALAGLTLAYLGYNPMAFIEAMERVGQDFPNHSAGFHPPTEIRRRLVEQIIPKKYLQFKSKTSTSLRELKNLLKNIGNQNPS